MPDSSLLLQLIVIIVTARLCSLAIRRLAQPPVIGEMLGGLLLGPLVLGALLPGFHSYLFAPASLGALESIGQLGLVLFMFVVGCEIRAPGGTSTPLRAAGYVGTFSVALPAALGLGVAPVLYPRLAPRGVEFWPFALFVAVSLSITAFPVMARILKDQQRTHTPVGQLSLSSAALVDVFAWIMLALVLALIGTEAGWGAFFTTLGGLVGLTALALGVLGPFYARLLRRPLTESSDGTLLAALIVGMLACALVTEWLHLHAVFGAFLFGVCLPRDHRLLNTLIERVEHIAVVAFMPVFFALVGLQTTPAAFSGTGGLLLLLITLVAVAGKIAGAAAGARIAGYAWRESLAVGSLMNTRGLMEIVVVQVGLESGVIGSELYTILVIVAVVTTMITSPLLLICDAAPSPGTGEPPSLTGITASGAMSSANRYTGKTYT